MACHGPGLIAPLSPLGMIQIHSGIHAASFIEQRESKAKLFSVVWPVAWAGFENSLKLDAILLKKTSVCNVH